MNPATNLSDMNISLNQHTITIAAESSLIDLLALQQIKPEGIAIAINNRIIPRGEWAATLLQAEDNVVLIQATYGG